MNVVWNFPLMSRGLYLEMLESQVGIIMRTQSYTAEFQYLHWNTLGLPSSSVTSEEDDPGGSEAAAAAAPLLTGSLGRQRRVSFREAKTGGRSCGGGGGGAPEPDCPQCRLQYYGGEVAGGDGADYRDGQRYSISL